MKIDLHMHSTASDGSLTPGELVERAHNLHVEVISITDHDSVAGIAEARQRAAKLTGGVVPQIVTGIELSSRWQGHEIHVLGWCFDLDNKALTELIAAQQRARQERAEQMIDKLSKQQIDEACLQPVRARQDNVDEVITRKHLADALVTGGYVATVDEAFKRYLGKGNCAYVAPQWCSLEDAVGAIQAAGGVTSLAHPLAYQLSSKWLKRLLAAYKDVGGEALEVASGQQAPQQRLQLAQLANDYSLMSSVGSDFHGPGRWRELGRNLSLPDGCRPVWQHWDLSTLVRDQRH
ncbi:PHP domain-containing protein [Aliidiomarina soli]|uniref:Polymerase/histidinol phosphatase N-terminal domain-containing protein n=1 Tax=Aliidiomarina soli TaxID=1928574 RepID=A0A432WHA4_9GAMM|nr:PHP domain-containing protein [Aliidiomarina soli]RUO33069.1 hypothetical protein CWE14_07495 [Aliidiomarina soli]